MKISKQSLKLIIEHYLFEQEDDLSALETELEDEIADEAPAEDEEAPVAAEDEEDEEDAEPEPEPDKEETINLKPTSFKIPGTDAKAIISIKDNEPFVKIRKAGKDIDLNQIADSGSAAEKKSAKEDALAILSYAMKLPGKKGQVLTKYLRDIVKIDNPDGNKDLARYKISISDTYA